MNAATAVKGHSALEEGYGAVRKREEVEARIASCREECFAANAEQNALERERETVSEQHASALAKLAEAEKRGDDAAMPALKDKVGMALSKLQDIRVKRDAAEARKNERNAELLRLETDGRMAARSGATIEALQAHASLMERAEADAKEIERLIAQQHDQIIKARAEIPSPALTEGEREDLLAAVAAGTAPQAELDSLDRKIAEERTAMEQATKTASAVVATAESTIAGLERRKHAAREHEQAMRHEGQRLFCTYLYSEAEAIGAEYRRHALAAREAILRVRAIQELLKSSGEKSAQLFNHNFGRFWMPTLRLQLFGGTHASGELCSAESDAAGAVSAYDKAFQSEVARLKNLGVLF